MDTAVSSNVRPATLDHRYALARGKLPKVKKKIRIEMRRKRTEIVVETREVLTFFHPNPLIVEQCVVCSDTPGMVTPELAASICRVSTRAIYSLLAANEIHFRETSDGLVFICLSSLFAALDSHPDEECKYIS